MATKGEARGQLGRPSREKRGKTKTHCKYCATIECGSQIRLSTPQRRMTNADSVPMRANSRILG
jgi:hypothetical protein